MVGHKAKVKGNDHFRGLLASKLALKAGNRKAKNEPPHAPEWVQRYKTGRDALTVQEVSKLLGACQTNEEHALLGLAIAGGMRREDIVTVERARIHDDKDVNGNPVLMVEFHEKKKHREWRVPVGREARLAIIRYMNGTRQSRWLFPGHQRGDRHLSSRTAYNLFQRVLKYAGLKQRPFHALRATCIKQRKSEGWTAEMVAELVGDTIRTIQEHYSTPSEDEMKEAAASGPPQPSAALMRAVGGKPEVSR